MKLLIKPTDTNLDSYINAGVSAFLFGIENFSSFYTKEISIKKLKELLNKYKNIDIFVSIDKNIFEEELELLNITLKELSKLKIKGLFFYDLSIINIVKTNNYNIPLIVAQNFLITNYETCNFYQTLGCKGALITTEITKEEVKEISENTNLDIYANIFGYQLMAFSKRPLVSDYYKEIKKINFKKANYMKKEGKDYFIEENKTGTIMLSDYILDGYDCLKNFKSCKYVILNEQNIKHEDFIKVLKIYTGKDYFKISKIIKNTSEGFLNTKTVYKVK